MGINLHRGFEDELVIFGHSLGAAEATILGMLLSADGWRVTRVYASGAAAFGYLPLIRIVNEGDPVPLLPPRALVSAADPCVHIGDAVDLWRSLKTNTLRGDAKEHFIAAYIERIRPVTLYQRAERRQAAPTPLMSVK